MRQHVGDAPRQADIVLLRRTSAGAPPFTGLWRWLTGWNVLEFKGPTVSARVDDLDALVELGLGVHRHLNEEQAKQPRSEAERALDEAVKGVIRDQAKAKGFEAPKK